MFTGTERRSSMTVIAEEIESIGAQFNASTGRELTYYWIRCTADQLRRGVEILADMLRHTRFDPAEIEREKGVIVEEMLQTRQAPREYVDEVLEHLLYGDHPLGWFLDGEEETVRRMTPEVLHAFWARWYTPERTVVGLAGNVDEETVPLLEELLEGGESMDARPEPAPESSKQRVELECKDSSQAELCLGVQSYPRAHADRYVVEIMRTLLGGGMSSRLYHELVAERGLTYSAAAFVKAYADVGSLMLHSSVNVNRAEEALAAMVEILRGLSEERVGEEELAKARNYTKGRFVFGLETPLDLALFGVRREVFEGQVAEPNEVLAGLDAVTAEDVERVAADLLKRGPYLAVIGPFDSAERFERLLS